KRTFERFLSCFNGTRLIEEYTTTQGICASTTTTELLHEVIKSVATKYKAIEHSLGIDAVCEGNGSDNNLGPWIVVDEVESSDIVVVWTNTRVHSYPAKEVGRFWEYAHQINEYLKDTINCWAVDDDFTARGEIW